VTDDRSLMRLALDEAPVAADRGDPGFGAVVARAGQILARAAVPKSLITIRSPTTASPFSAGRAVEADACC
jgi:tRNA(Arg) A34 adenosine deaminase TadA